MFVFKQETKQGQCIEAIATVEQRSVAIFVLIKSDLSMQPVRLDVVGECVQLLW